MTESWAPDPLTPEQEAEYAKSIAEASEEQPFQPPQNVGEDPDDPPQIDRRPAIERYLPSEEKPAEKEAEPAKKPDAPAEPARDDKGRFLPKEPDKAEPAKAQEPVAKTEPEKPEPHAGKPIVRPEWWEKVPKEAQEYIDNLHAARTQARRSKQESEAESKRRFKEMERIVGERIEAALKAKQPVQEPDPDIDPEGFKRYHQERSQQASKIIEDTQKLTKEQEAQQEFNTYLLETERDFQADHPDYTAAVQWAFQKELSRRLSDWPGRNQQIVERELLQELGAIQRKYHQEEGNWPEWAYQKALQLGWGKENVQQPAATAATQPAARQPSVGEKTAEAIAAGTQAAKALGKTGTTTNSTLTLEDIYNIKNPEEHAREYQKWVDAQLGRSPEWH